MNDQMIGINRNLLRELLLELLLVESFLKINKIDLNKAFFEIHCSATASQLGYL